MPALDIVDAAGEPRSWAAAFPPEEYKARHARVRAELARSGIDTLYVTSPANLAYLTGYDSRWYRRSPPTGLAVRQDSEETIFFGRPCRQIAMMRALVTCCAVMAALIDQPTTRRENKSRTAATYSQPSAVQM